jgi:SAM-dependent methyltransferase
MNRNGNMKVNGHKNRRLYPRLADPDFLHLFTLREMIRQTANNCHGEILDYGCGSKPYRELFDRSTCYIGADFAVGEKGDITLYPDGALPSIENSFDVVVSFQVLEHVPSPGFFLTECMRVLRPGGTLLLTTHGMWPYHPGPHNDDFLRWTAAGLHRLATENGFQDISVVPVCGGYLCLLQQLLVVHDPSRTKKTVVASLFSSVFNCLINSFGAMLLNATPDVVQRGDILPVCYLLLARKLP